MTEPTTRVKLTEPGQILPVVPLLLGFEPKHGDIVTLGLSNGRILVTTRMDADQVTTHRTAIGGMYRNLAGHGVDSVILVGYGEGSDVTPAMDQVSMSAGAELPVLDALRVEGDRFWSYTCQEVECCPPEGRHFEHETTATTELRAAGLATEASRDDVAARIAPAEMTEETRLAWQAAEAQPPAVREGRQLVQDALSAARDGRQLSDSEVARLGVAMRELAVRDDAWARMTPNLAEEHRTLWADVVHRTPDEAVAAPASLLAFTAWQNGDGAQANLAVDRALEAQPGYSMATLLSTALEAALPPSLAVPPLTPEEVAASYPDPEAEPEMGAEL